MRFFLGTHRAHWLATSHWPLFVSRVQLKDRRSFPRATIPWALDSGGYTALDQPPHRWTLPVEDYAAEVKLYAEMGCMMWAAPQDWMCEPWIIEKTGLSVAEHQEHTVENFVALRALQNGYPRFIPVLQGFTYEDYEHCLELYAQAGVNLQDEQVIGLGTVCRRQHSDEIEALVRDLAGHGLRLHGFGVKTRGLARYKRYLVSADSMAWSFQARRNPDQRLPGHTHKNCANCFEYAMLWADRLAQRMKND